MKPRRCLLLALCLSVAIGASADARPGDRHRPASSSRGAAAAEHGSSSLVRLGFDWESLKTWALHRLGKSSSSGGSSLALPPEPPEPPEVAGDLPNLDILDLDEG